MFMRLIFPVDVADAFPYLGGVTTDLNVGAAMAGVSGRPRKGKSEPQFYKRFGDDEHSAYRPFHALASQKDVSRRGSQPLNLAAAVVCVLRPNINRRSEPGQYAKPSTAVMSLHARQVGHEILCQFSSNLTKFTSVWAI